MSREVCLESDNNGFSVQLQMDKGHAVLIISGSSFRNGHARVLVRRADFCNAILCRFDDYATMFDTIMAMHIVDRHEKRIAEELSK
jgi:hypothetical protein